jgi:plasmid stability protein
MATMGSITIRNLSDGVKESARVIAAQNGRSLEAEIRTLLERTYGAELSDRAKRLRAMTNKELVDHLIAVAGGAGIDLPERTIGAEREIFGAD